MAHPLKHDEVPHALLFPFPAVGHTNTMMKLASSLSSSFGFKVTVLITEHRLAQMQEKEIQKEQKPDLHQNNSPFSFYAFPDGLSAEDHAGPSSNLKLFGAMGKMAGTDIFESVLRDLQSRGTAVDLIISDTFLSWTHFVAEKLGIPRVGFWTSCASSYLLHHHTHLLMAQGLIPLSESSDRNQMLELPGLCPLPVDKLPSVMQVTDISNMEFNAFLRLFENDRKCGKLIINSYTDLEPEQFKRLTDDFRMVRAVGPLLPMELVLKKATFQGAESRMQILKEDRSCLEWLESKPASSVLYVSFGTTVSLGKEELHQLALGLESSKQNFLWVIRGFSALGEGTLPKGFLERTKDQGLIINWAPQLEVLTHPSVGGFLTHCGWNSVLESLSCGVPLIAVPTDFAEHKMLAWLIEHTWNVGFQLKVDCSGMVSQMKVEVAVKALMEDEEGAVNRRNALKFSECAKKAVLPGGSSQEGLQHLAQQIRNS